MNDPTGGRSRNAPGFAPKLVLVGVGVFVLLLLTIGAGVFALTSSSPSPSPSSAPTSPATITSIPASRAAKNVVVISIHDAIDDWTARSVIRRIHEAEQEGADAIVIDLDTPGGGITSVLAITNALKSSSIKNTLAWVNPTAYSGGCIIALACREIVVTDRAAMGDALPIEIHQLEGLRTLGDAEREKIAGPVMADMIDSARRNNYDEMLVQGFLRRGAKLWLIENTETKQRFFVNEQQYAEAVGEEPGAMTPTFSSAVKQPKIGKTLRSQPETSPINESRAPTDMVPAGNVIDPKVQAEINEQLADTPQLVPKRPDFASPEHTGKYRVVEYVSDGGGVLVLRGGELVKYGLATQIAGSTEDVRAYFGASNVATIHESRFEAGARFLSSFWIQSILIVIFLVALFIEMTHPGLVLPGVVAAVCIVGLAGPMLLINLASWWIVAAIVVGVVCIGVELFVTPGFIVFGALGLVLLMGGLVGVVMGGTQNLFPGGAGVAMDSGRLMASLATTLVSMVVAIVITGFLMRHLKSVPMLRGLVLTSDVSDPGADMPMFESEPTSSGLDTALVGQIATVISPLRPSGRVDLNGQIMDARLSTSAGVVNTGERVKVVGGDGLRLIVELLV